MKGIYKITNKINNKIYIGSSEDILQRWKRHIDNLMGNYHHSYKLQDDWNKYTYTAFTFEIVEIVSDKNDLLSKEQYWINEYNSYDDSKGYNIMAYTDYKGIKYKTEELNNLNYCDNINTETKQLLIKNLNILKNDKINNIGDNEFALSKTWYSKNHNNLKILNGNYLNYYRYRVNSYSKNSYWTTFISYQSKLSQREGYIKSFISMNSINVSDKRNNLAFLVNCYINKFYKRELNKYNIEVDENKYSLSILLKWIIEVSNINNKINIYIPSKRMRNLLLNWIQTNK